VNERPGGNDFGVGHALPPHVHEVVGIDVRAGKCVDAGQGVLPDGSPFVVIVFAEIAKHIGEPDDPQEFSCPQLWQLDTPERIELLNRFIDGLTEARDAAVACTHWTRDGIVHCPSCGRQLFGLVKVRGMCYDCVPDPKDEL
jgi:hypothetical protein